MILLPSPLDPALQSALLWNPSSGKLLESFPLPRHPIAGAPESRMTVFLAETPACMDPWLLVPGGMTLGFVVYEQAAASVRQLYL